VAAKFPRREQLTLGAYRQSLVEGLFSSMLNMRLFDLTQKADPPFVRAGAGRGGLVRPLETWSLSVTAQNNGLERGLEAALVEVTRAVRHGFTAGELERAPRLRRPARVDLR